MILGFLVRISDSSIQPQVLSGEYWSVNEDSSTYFIPTRLVRYTWSYMTSVSFPNFILETTSDTPAK